MTKRIAYTLLTAGAFGLLMALLASTSALAADPQWTEEEQAAGVKKLEFVRYAFAGKVQNLQLLYALNPDCSEVEGWEFEITKQPEHGVANIEPYSAFPFYPKDNPRYKCNEHKIQMQVLTYQAKCNGRHLRIHFYRI